jgi:hypothetical protein
MSVISSIAEDASLANQLKHDTVRTAIVPMAGRFKVIRTEIGAVEMSLRDIVVKIFETELKKMGVNYQFPAADSITNHKQAFEAAMPSLGDDFVERYVASIKEKSDLVIQNVGVMKKAFAMYGYKPEYFIRGIGTAITALIANSQKPFEQLVMEEAKNYFARLQNDFTEQYLSLSDIERAVYNRILDQKTNFKPYDAASMEFYTAMCTSASKQTISARCRREASIKRHDLEAFSWRVCITRR